MGFSVLWSITHFVWQYGPSCMPAMLMEARCIMGTEHQLKTVNDQLQQVLDETENE